MKRYVASSEQAVSSSDKFELKVYPNFDKMIAGEERRQQNFITLVSGYWRWGVYYFLNGKMYQEPSRETIEEALSWSMFPVSRICLCKTHLSEYVEDKADRSIVETNLRYISELIGRDFNPDDILKSERKHAQIKFVAKQLQSQLKSTDVPFTVGFDDRGMIEHFPLKVNSQIKPMSKGLLVTADYNYFISDQEAINFLADLKDDLILEFTEQYPEYEFSLSRHTTSGPRGYFAYGIYIEERK